MISASKNKYDQDKVWTDAATILDAVADFVEGDGTEKQDMAEIGEPNRITDPRRRGINYVCDERTADEMMRSVARATGFEEDEYASIAAMWEDTCLARVELSTYGFTVWASDALLEHHRYGKVASEVWNKMWRRKCG